MPKANLRKHLKSMPAKVVVPKEFKGKKKNFKRIDKDHR